MLRTHVILQMEKPRPTQSKGGRPCSTLNVSPLTSAFHYDVTEPMYNVITPFLLPGISVCFVLFWLFRNFISYFIDHKGPKHRVSTAEAAFWLMLELEREETASDLWVRWTVGTRRGLKSGALRLRPT